MDERQQLIEFSGHVSALDAVVQVLLADVFMADPESAPAVVSAAMTALRFRATSSPHVSDHLEVQAAALRSAEDIFSRAAAVAGIEIGPGAFS